MKWLSISGIIEELRRVLWPTPKQLASQTGSVLLFTTAFALFFLLCEVVAATFIRFIGM